MQRIEVLEIKPIELKYQRWLCEKLNTLANLQHRRKSLSRHERRYIRNVQWRIKTLFEDQTISPEEIETYKKIVSEHGFLFEQVIGKMPIYYGEIIPQIRVFDEETIGVVWLGKFKLKACA